MTSRRSIIAKRLCKIARILKILAGNDFGISPAKDAANAHVAIQSALSNLELFSDSFAKIVDYQNKESQKPTRRLSNFFTMLDDNINNRFNEVQSQINAFMPKCISALEKSLKSNSIEEIKQIIYASNRAFHNLISEFTDLIPQLNKMADKEDRRTESFHLFQYAIKEAQNFIFEMAKSLGFSNIKQLTETLATNNFNEMTRGIKASNCRRIRSRAKLASLGI